MGFIKYITACLKSVGEMLGGSCMSVDGVNDPNLGDEKLSVSDKKLSVSDENLSVSYEKLPVSDEKLPVSYENLQISDKKPTLINRALKALNCAGKFAIKLAEIVFIGGPIIIAVVVYAALEFSFALTVLLLGWIQIAITDIVMNLIYYFPSLRKSI